MRIEYFVRESRSQAIEYEEYFHFTYLAIAEIEDTVFLKLERTSKKICISTHDSHSPVVVVVPEIRKNIKILVEEFF